MLAIYLLSWAPATLYRVQYNWFGGDHKQFIENVKFVNMLLQLHSCINPYIFMLRTKDVKDGVLKMLRKIEANRIIPLQSDRCESPINAGSSREMTQRLNNNSYFSESGIKKQDNGEE